MAECIRRRRALRLAEQTELAYIAQAAAQGGKKAFGPFRRVIRSLRQEAGAEERTDAEKLAATLGLSDHRRPEQS